MGLLETYNNLLESSVIIKRLISQNKNTIPKIRTNKVFFHDTPDVGFYTKVTSKAQNFIGTDKFEDEEVDVKMIVPTQRNLNITNIKDVMGVGENTGAELVKDNQFYYVIDGHHRIASRILLGDDKIIAKVFTN